MNQDAIVTEAGKRLVGHRDAHDASCPTWTLVGDDDALDLCDCRLAERVSVIEAEAAQRALDDVRAKVEALTVIYQPPHALTGLVSRSAVHLALQDRGADREDVRP